MHEDGDLLVLSTFENGGVVPQVAVYKWSCPTGATAAQCAVAQSSTNPNGGVLSLVTSSNGADCVNGVDTHGNPVPAVVGDVCATVNTKNNVPSPWPFTEKSSDGSYVTANQFGNGTFFEGGLDLTNLGFGDTCFSSFLGETRSSQSTTATLSDIVSGTFKRCSASITTSQSASAPVNPGATVTDTATVTGSGPTTPPFPTSSTDTSVSGAPGTPVSFGYCFSTTQISSCSGLTVNAFDTKNLQNSNTQGVSTATSKAFDTTNQPPGYYCFTASWGGDTNYPGKISDDGSVGTPGGNTECFQVRQLSTTTVTTPSDGSGTALNSPVPFDTTLYDTAVVTASAAGEGSPTGTVSFVICNPTEIGQDKDGNPVCPTDKGTALSGNPRTLVAIANSSPPASSVLSSPGVEGNIAGTWCFRATYTPDTTAFTGSSDNTTDECVTVNKAATTTVTSPHDDSNTSQSYALSSTGLNVKDNVTVTGVTNGGNPTGTVQFWLCGPGQDTAVTGSGSSATCAPDTTTATPVDGTQTLTAIANSSPPASSASSSDVQITQTGQYCFYAKFTPSGSNGNYTGSSDGSNEECFTVVDATSAISAQTWMPNDSATITSTGGSALNGTLTFTLYPDGDCGATEPNDNPLFAQQFTLSNSASPTTKSTDTSQPLGTAGVLVALGSPVESPGATVSWNVAFSSTDANLAGSNHCEKSVVTITN